MLIFTHLPRLKHPHPHLAYFILFDLHPPCERHRWMTPKVTLLEVTMRTFINDIVSKVPYSNTDTQK